MSACLVVAGVLQCIVSTTPPLSPQAAADVLRARQFVAAPALPREPLVVIVPSKSMDGPYGELVLTPSYRWDGYSYGLPVYNYGSYTAIPWWSYALPHSSSAPRATRQRQRATR